MTKGELRAARKAAHAAGTGLTGTLRVTAEDPALTAKRQRKARARLRETGIERWARINYETEGRNDSGE